VAPTSSRRRSGRDCSATRSTRRSRASSSSSSCRACRRESSRASRSASGSSRGEPDLRAGRLTGEDAPPDRITAAIPAFVSRPPTGHYRSLNPTTKLVVAFATALIAFGVRGWTGPLVILVVVAAIVVISGVGRTIGPYVLATTPLLVSVLLVNAFFFPGATDTIVAIGPFVLTGSGLVAGLQGALRIVAFALSVAAFSLTTPTDDLLTDLERRGVGRRAIFVIGTAIGTIPRMLERAGEIVESQRARGMDTEGSPLRRARGVLPLAGPMVLGALGDVEERTMALEARGFSAGGRRTILRALPDSGWQRTGRWALGIGSIAIVALTLAGVVSLP
jgi:energy-coupling factor transport system permease protein